jgi:uncharacterized membrane protein YhaH (DUF805 family)
MSSTRVVSKGEDRPRIFSLSQRIGRLRYLVYSLLGILACVVFLILVYLLALLLPVADGKLVSTITYIVVKNLVMPLIVLVLTIRRVHDFDLRGWWALLALIPLVTLVFLFIPGSKGNNRFGPPLTPNHPGLRFVAIALPIALLGFYFSPYMRKNEVVPTSQPSVPGLAPLPPASKLKQY